MLQFMSKVYLDYNATAPIHPDILDLVTKVMNERVGNASSVHSFGRDARKYVEDARHQIAALCAVEPEQVIFTSGATESNNTILNSFQNKRILVSTIEHPAILEAAGDAERILVTRDGIIDMDAYEKILNTGDPPALVSIMLVNSETGVIQPIADMAKMAHDKGALFHTDAVQGAGRVDLTLEKLGVDYISLSSHKMSGPQGVGAIIFRKGLELRKFMRGGGQEKNCRAGTHNTAGIAGMGLAAEHALNNLNDNTIQKLRDYLESEIKKISSDVIIYGENAPRVGNTSDIGLPGVPAETQLMALDLESIAVSSGSACSSGSFKPSHVLMAMGCTEDEAKSALRISLGYATTQTDIDRFIDVWSKMVKRTKK